MINSFLNSFCTAWKHWKTKGFQFFRGYRKRLVAWNELTLSWRRSLSHRNQSIDLLCKSLDCFLYDRDLCHKRVKDLAEPFSMLPRRPEAVRSWDLFNFWVETNFNDICRPHWTFFMFFSIVVKYRRWSIATSCWTNIHCILLGWKSQQTNDFIVSNNWSVYNASLRRANKEIRVDVKWKGPSLGGMIALNLFSANKPQNKSQASHIFHRIASNFRWNRATSDFLSGEYLGTFSLSLLVFLV